ncbi:esterase/lipase family protein [Actinoplanes sp. NPDC000266]
MRQGDLRPLVLVRGFGGADVGDVQASGYQGFNDGTVYPGRRGDNYIYEGFVLRAMKAERYPYRDATNVVGYYADGNCAAPPDDCGFDASVLSGSVAVDASAGARILEAGVAGTMWVYRFYDLRPRTIECFGAGLARLIDIIAKCAARRGETFRGVDILAHSMGGLVVNAALKNMTEAGIDARDMVHRIVTLGTPHRGIAFNLLPRWMGDLLPRSCDAGDELAAFDPCRTAFLEVASRFDPRRILTVVGTDYRSYGTRMATLANRVAGLFDEGSLENNRSDGLVKQASAQLPGSPRTFVHKCHGGRDSLVTSREAYEIAMRFFHGTHRVCLWLDDADVSSGGDHFGRSEFYLGVSIKPLYVDFELFHQSAEAENCYGPFHDRRLADPLPDRDTELSRPLAECGDRTNSWAGPDRLIWEGWLDANLAGSRDPVFRLDIYLSERDAFGIGFSDNVVYRKQLYVQAVLGSGPVTLYVHNSERFLGPNGPAGGAELEGMAENSATAAVQRAEPTGRPGEWTFRTQGASFAATWRVAMAAETS